ncbi:MAG: hypothetical protein JSV37_02135 [Anaerolineaceae bacterium]|nr:MAG: hypothetical protein JSV37_02135 [Anaerolineaceae bacterium]
MDPQILLRKAEDHIFSTGLDDSGARLGLTNMKYGLAKILMAQEAYGLEPNAYFVAAPDATVTRNANRWKSGFGYGGLLAWGDGGQELVVLDVKPNCCGMLVLGLDQIPTQSSLTERIKTLHEQRLEINGMPVQWDFGISNHFITLFRVTPLDETSFHPYAVILHGSGKELRNANPWGDGLYWDWSESLEKKAELFSTPMGPLRLLTGSAANEYYAYFLQAKAFSQERRVLIAQHLFDEFTIYSNENHQGLLSMNEMVLGVHVMRDEETILPLTLQAQLPSYLLRVLPNLSEDVIQSLGFEEQARRIGIYDQLLSVNILPHGGGYAYPHIAEVVSVNDYGQDERYFELSFCEGEGTQIIKNVRDLPYTYRGLEVIDQVKQLELGRIVAQLVPIYVFKF